METTLQQSISENYIAATANPSLFKRFINWTNSQEKNRFTWIGAALAGHGCVLTPATLFAIILSGNSITLWVLSIMAMMAALVTNLAAMPTKITIPTFILTIVIDLVIIISCIATGFNASAALI